MNRELGDALEKIILPVIAVASDASWHPIGTAFVIAAPQVEQALVLTAKHNLMYVARLDRHDPGVGTVPEDFRVKEPDHIVLERTRYFVGVEGTKGFELAEVIKSWFVKDLDIAVAAVRLKEDSGARFETRAAIDTTPPVEGSEVRAVGYCGMSAGFASEPDYDGQKFKITFTKRLEWRTGSITRVLRQGIGICKWPGFLLNTRLDSGMSGGPVVGVHDDALVARGVICGDMSEDVVDGKRGSGAHAFASALWPALATAVEIDIVKTSTSQTASASRLIDLVRLGVIDDRGDSLNRFKLMATETGETILWEDKLSVKYVYEEAPE